MISDEQFVRIIKKHGSDRVLFASDSPWGEQKRTLERVKALIPCSNDLELILGKNAQKLFGI
jgi:predicted TIM-barrel fold metal-dependent hydrolase